MWKKAIRSAVGAGGFSDNPAELDLYSFDATVFEHLPDCVVFPSSTAEVSAILKIASAEGIPVVPRGAGSGLAGGAVPVKGGIVLSLARMNRILGVDQANLVCFAEAGCVTGAIAKAVAGQGLYYPPDPASLNFCTIGGNIAHNSGGLHAVKYGVTKNWVLGLTAVLPGGEIIKTGVSTMKGVVGYDLTKLICGSEGTLAVVTEVTLKLIPEPQHRVVILAEFPGMVDAGTAVSTIIAKKILPAALEFMDRVSLDCVREYIDPPPHASVNAMLLIELDGHPDGVRAESEVVESILRGCGSSGIRKAEKPAEREKLWAARRALNPALGKVSPRRVREDITVPRSAIPEALEAIAELGAGYGIGVAVFGHAGDGNLHVNMLVDSTDREKSEMIESVTAETLRLALRLGGTMSGEHGIGIAKSEYLGFEIGPECMDVLKSIKRSFDPKGILNPGKIFPQKAE